MSFNAQRKAQWASPTKSYPEHQVGWSVLAFLRRVSHVEETVGTSGRVLEFVRGLIARPQNQDHNKAEGKDPASRTAHGDGTEPIGPAQSVPCIGVGEGYSLADCGPVSRDTRTGRFVSKRSSDPRLKKAKPTGKKPYRLHLIWQHGKDDEMWVELGSFYYLQSAYKRMTKMRVNLAKYRCTAKVLRVPTLVIEFTKTGMVRTFPLVPDVNLSVRRISSELYTGRPTPMITSWYYPKSWILDNTKKLKKRGKKKRVKKGHSAELNYA